MNESTWKLLAPLQNGLQCVWRRFSDGREESMLLTAPEIQAWLAEGNTPEPADQPSHAQLVEQTLSLARQERQPIISVLDGLQASALAKSDLQTAQTIETAKQQLRDITKIDLSACTTAEEMRQSILGAYAAIVATNPSLKLAFKEVTA